MTTNDAIRGGISTAEDLMARERGEPCRTSGLEVLLARAYDGGSLPGVDQPDGL